MDDIIHRFSGLSINGSCNKFLEQKQSALVPYKGDGAVVPYEGSEFIKKRKPRPKVELDSETNRIWNILMGKEGSEGIDGPDKQKEKHWEEERKVFQGRVDSFIARMHLVQGTIPYLFVLNWIIMNYQVAFVITIKLRHGHLHF